MTRALILLTLLLLSSAALTVRAQDEEGTAPQITDLFAGSFASTREMLLYRKTAGPYAVTVQGERFTDRAYFEIAVTRDGQPVADSTVVTVDVEPSRQTDQILISDDVINETGTPTSYTAQARGEGLFVVNPMRFDSAGGWLAQVTIEGDSGVGRTSFQTRVYPHQPDTPIWFSLASLSVPFLVTLIVLIIYRWRNIALIQDSVQEQSY